MSQSGTHCLNTGTSHIIERILFGQRPTGSLRVSTQSQRFRIFRIELLYNLRPQQTTGTHFGNFHKMIGPNSPEKRQTGCKSIHIHSGTHPGTQIFQTVRQSISQFNIRRSTCFLHMITGNRNRIKLRHILGSILENISDNFHREFRRVNISITHHKLFQNIILNRTRQLVQSSPLFQTGNNIECQNREYRTVHSHRYRHFVQRNLVEQDFHI